MKTFLYSFWLDIQFYMVVSNEKIKYNSNVLYKIEKKKNIWKL